MEFEVHKSSLFSSKQGKRQDLYSNTSPIFEIQSSEIIRNQTLKKEVLKTNQYKRSVNIT